MDTPLWYMKVGRSVEARQSMVWLRGTGYDLRPELKELEDLLTADGGQVDKLALLTKRTFVFPVLILSVLFWVHASVGGDTLAYYALTLFIFPGVLLSPNVIAFFFQMSFTIGMLSTALLPNLNRRPQFILGALSIA